MRDTHGQTSSTGAQESGRHRADLAGADLADHGSTGHGVVDVVRSEEQLRVGTVREPVERVRLHRDVVVEQVTRTFEVRREVLRIEREPIVRGGDGPLVGVPRTTPEVVEVVLREERPVVSLEVVPVERVRIAVVPLEETVRVDEDVRVEQVDLEEVALDAPPHQGLPTRT